MKMLSLCAAKLDGDVGQQVEGLQNSKPGGRPADPASWSLHSFANLCQAEVCDHRLRRRLLDAVECIFQPDTDYKPVLSTILFLLDNLQRWCKSLSIARTRHDRWITSQATADCMCSLWDVYCAIKRVAEDILWDLDFFLEDGPSKE
ncbi:hypothetical protein WJX73_002138 [Symbiochloris irregularis]|uniref:Uncharacterized protein n=1 Tax=Symbiochloris irregularis TaxID=706552 RepID=A0AAW1P296_9CHLO